jgi:putative heme-binding domain-containing protein
VREHAVRLSEAAAGASEPLRRRLAALAEDGDARVRYQLAFTLGEVGGPERLAGLLALARRDAGDPWMRFAIASSLFGQEADLVAALLADPATRRGDGSRMLLAELAGLLARGGSESDAERALAAIAALADADADLSRALLSAILAGLRARGSPLAARFLDAGSEAGAVWSAILDRARAQALDRRLEAPARIEAVRTLALSERESERRSLAALLDGLEPAEVQLAALDALGRSAGGGAGALVIAAWPGLGPRAREAAAELLIRRPAWLAAALDAIEAGTLRVFDLGRPRLEALERHPDPSLRSRVAAALAADGLGARPEVAARYAAALTLEGHPERGKAAFLKSCASCHRVESRAFGAIGVEIGPNLLAFRDRGPEAYLLSVLDPNREVQPQYQTYLVLSRDGRAATGLIAAESAASITLRRAGGEGETVLRSEILSLSGTGQSLMPEGLENELDPQAMADLLAWIYQLR